MKNLFKIFALALIISSCSSDDDASSSNNSVEGTYRLTSFTTETSFDLDGDGDSSTNLLEETGCLQNETLVFLANNTGSAISTTFLDIFVDIDDEGNISQVIDCIPEDFTTNFTWTQNGSVVSFLDEDGFSIDATLSGDELVFVLGDGFELEVLEGVDTAALIETVTFVYTRQ